MSENKVRSKKILFSLIGILLVVFSAVACLIYAIATDNMSELPVPASVRILGEYKIAEGDWEEIEYDKVIPANKGNITLRGKLILTDKDGNFIAPAKNGMEMALYLNHISVEVFINEQKVHIFDVENPMIGHQACVKDFVNFKYVGEEDDIIKMVIHNPHKFGNSNAVNELLDSMYWGNTTIWQDVYTSKGAFERAIGFFIVMITFIAIGVAFFATILKLKNIERFWYMALISFFAGAYFVFSSKNVALWNKEAILDNYVLVISLMMLVFFTLCLATSLMNGKTKKVGMGLVIISGLSDAILYIGVCKNLINIYDALWPFAIINLTSIIITLCFFISCMINVKSAKERAILICYFIFLFSIIIDILNVHFLWWQEVYVAKILFLIIFMVGIVIATIEIPKYFAMSLKTSELAKELQEQKLSSMISQIQPHFIFNSLTTIMYLCEENPNLARETLEKFSFFLRGTFDSLGLKECVSINYELDIVKNYLYVEKQRFGDKLEVEYDIKSEDFFIPILSIQPIVENAVRHGIRKRAKGGKVVISTFSDKDYHVVKILDNGVGFSEEIIGEDKNVHVGIKNVKERIKLMTGGTVDIMSKVNVGTEVVMKIPRK